VELDKNAWKDWILLDVINVDVIFINVCHWSNGGLLICEWGSLVSARQVITINRRIRLWPGRFTFRWQRTTKVWGWAYFLPWCLFPDSTISRACFSSFPTFRKISRFSPTLSLCFW
jgi:hypothetical protein